MNETSFEPAVLYEPPIPQDGLREGRVILRDGTTAILRPAREEDYDRVVELLESLSQRSRYQRFFSGSTPVDTMAERLLVLGNPEDRYTLVVLSGEPEDQKIIGLGSYSREESSEPDEPVTAEPAFLVHEEYQGRGIGTLLLERLALLAVRHGIERFRAYTLPDNQKMKEVFKSSGFDVTTSSERGSYIVSFPVTPSQEMVSQSELRDRIATVASLKPFFEPSSVAVIGASRDRDSIGHRILTSLLRGEFNGPVYPVNPAADTVASMPAYDSVLDIDRPLDMAVVAVPPGAITTVVEECNQKEIRALVIVTAGFSETGESGQERQRELRERIYGYGMRMIGPNCLGLINTDPEISLNASFSPLFPLEGNVAMASQSGALGLAILDYATSRGIGFSSFVSIGNKADVSGNDLIQYWEDDPGTDVILLYLESFGNPRRFAKLTRRIGLKKPIVVVKGGRSEAGRRAASSHTAALASPEIAVEALFEQAGIIAADSLEGMFNVAALLSSQPLPAGENVAIVTNSGGPGILSADACEMAGLTMADLTGETLEELDTFLPSTASFANPIDMIASAGPREYRRTVETVLADPNVDSVIVIYTPLELTPSREIADAVEVGIRRGRAHCEAEKPVSAVFIQPEDETTELRVGDQRIPTFRFPEAAARALGEAYRYNDWRESFLEDEPRIPRLEGMNVQSARHLCEETATLEGNWLGVQETVQVLDSVGITMAETHLATSPEEAVKRANSLGYPVVLKMASRTLIHKTEWDGIRLNLTSDGEVRDAYEEIRSRLEEAGKVDELDGMAVQTHVKRGTELMVGMTEDEVFGPLITFGLGGIHVEILNDVTVRITPLTDRDARSMINGIRGRKLLEGYRGHPASDKEALEELLIRLSQLVDQVPQIRELDMNPLKAFEPGEGYRVLDARIRVRSVDR